MNPRGGNAGGWPILIAAILGLATVVLAAAGSHVVDLPDERALRLWQTATAMLGFHALALLGIGTLLMLRGQVPPLTSAALLMTAGCLLFSGSLLLNATGIVATAGMVPPLGGLLLIGGWVCLGLAGARQGR